MIQVNRNCFRIDKIIVDLRQRVFLNNVAVFDEIKKIKGYHCDQKNRLHQISRGSLTAQVFQAGGSVFLQHGLCENGPRRLREVLGIPVQEVKDEFYVSDNFLPVEDRERCDVFKFMVRDFPSYLEDRIETDFADFTTNIGGAIRHGLGNRIVAMNEPARQSLCLRYVEAAADILVPKDFDIQDYRFQENVAAVGRLRDLEKNDPPNTLRGYTYRHNVEFVVYIKDQSHPKLNQIRVELKFDKEALRRIAKGVSFSLSNQNRKKHHRRPRPTLTDIFQKLLLEELEGFATTLFTFQHNLPVAQRNQYLLTAIREHVRTPQRQCFAPDVYRNIYERVISNHLVFKRSEFNQRVQEGLVQNGLFKRIPMSIGLYRVDQQKMLSVVRK